MLNLKMVHLLVELLAEGFCLSWIYICTWHFLGLLTGVRGFESKLLHALGGRTEEKMAPALQICYEFSQCMISSYSKILCPNDSENT